MLLFFALAAAITGLAIDSLRPLTQEEAERDDDYTPRGWY